MFSILNCLNYSEFDYFLMTRDTPIGTPGIKGNPGHFAMKFINLRRPGSKPVFVVLPTENRKYTFYINSVKVIQNIV